WACFPRSDAHPLCGRRRRRSAGPAAGLQIGEIPCLSLGFSRVIQADQICYFKFDCSSSRSFGRRWWESPKRDPASAIWGSGDATHVEIEAPETSGGG